MLINSNTVTPRAAVPETLALLAGALEPTGLGETPEKTLVDRQQRSSSTTGTGAGRSSSSSCSCCGDDAAGTAEAPIKMAAPTALQLTLACPAPSTLLRANCPARKHLLCDHTSDGGGDAEAGEGDTDSGGRLYCSSTGSMSGGSSALTRMHTRTGSPSAFAATLRAAKRQRCRQSDLVLKLTAPSLSEDAPATSRVSTPPPSPPLSEAPPPAPLQPASCITVQLRHNAVALTRHLRALHLGSYDMLLLGDSGAATAGPVADNGGGGRTDGSSSSSGGGGGGAAATEASASEVSSPPAAAGETEVEAAMATVTMLPLPLSVLLRSCPHLRDLSLGDAASEVMLPPATELLPASAAAALARLPSLRRLRLHQIHVRSASLPGLLATFCGSSGGGSSGGSGPSVAATAAAGSCSRLQLLEFVSPPSQQRVLGRAWCCLRRGAESAVVVGAAAAPAAVAPVAVVGEADCGARWELQLSGTLQMLALFAQVATPAAGGPGGLRVSSVRVPTLVVSTSPISAADCCLLRRFLAVNSSGGGGSGDGNGSSSPAGAGATLPTYASSLVGGSGTTAAVDTIMLCRHTRDYCRQQQPASTNAALLAAMRQAVALLGPPRKLLLKHASRSEDELLGLVQGLTAGGGRGASGSSGDVGVGSPGAAAGISGPAATCAAATLGAGAGSTTGGGCWPQERVLWCEGGATPAALAALVVRLLPGLRHLRVWGGGGDGAAGGAAGDGDGDTSTATAATKLAARLVAAAAVRGCDDASPESPPRHYAEAALQVHVPAVSGDAGLRAELNAALLRARVPVQFA
ncbi:hypothetical protein HXX76_005004 [Chlamydomonas incerta]|uniref:Uncharacterized protein n=1 Tax=Chlamydomonas incerta TaxID=51695 RepID=A0A835TG17_CHLIN|nr:hypothetical protein HXX76_005004 [Chlamydomonas incerta]|eukprot:KAG2439654.1 hypothetical protein HXX76_005004 [Chlamydomonas incerta]